MTRNKNLIHLAYGESQERPYSLREQLQAQHSLDFYGYRSGLFPASALSAEVGETTGMGLAWLRDNCHIANGLWESGDTESAVGAARAILDVFNQARPRIDDVVMQRVDPSDPDSRLPVRVNGDTLEPDMRGQVQNDSIGYSLWLTSRMITEGILQPTPEDLLTLAQTTRYLRAIEYWQDADSGHWEEQRKINASSIGTVMAGLVATREMFATRGINAQALYLDELIDRGRQQLDAILPYETRRPSSDKRRYDAALLFLVEPLNVVTPAQADQIIEDISTHLIRDIGVIRYKQDTYWSPDFRDQFGLGERATYAPGRLEERNLRAAQVAERKQEAQWTLFDPLISTYWGKKYLASGDPEAQKLQMHFLERSLAQLAPTDKGWQLPEAYFLERDEWLPNDHTPLLWSQANLLLALKTLERTSQI